MTPAEITDAVLEADKYREKIDVIDEALWDERRQTQRRMIAALYWRAGWAKDAAERERPSSQHRTALMRRYLSARDMASDMQNAMEDAL